MINKKLLAFQILLGAILGAIQVLAFAPYSYWFLVYPSIIGILILLQQVQKGTKKLFLVSFTYSLSMFLALLYWIHVSMDLFGGMPLIASISLIVLLCSYLALYPTLALWATFKISSRFAIDSKSIRYLLIFPVFWLISDWARGVMLTGFPWGYLGYSHLDTPLIGLAPVFGVQGVTLAILLISGAFTLLIEKQSMKVSIFLILTLLGSGFLLSFQTYTTLQAPIKVSLVQANIDQNEKWAKGALKPSLEKLLDLSKLGSSSDLIIWPESAIAALEINMKRFLQNQSEIFKENNQVLISGIIEYDLSSDQYYNSIITLGDLPTELEYSPLSKNRYRKHHLLPVGEFVPFEDLLRPLAPYFNLPMSSFNRGEMIQKNLSVKNINIASALCYEIIFSEQLRQNIDKNTGIILTLSNDAWFGDSIGPAQHLEIARMRAVEFARPLIRSTNNGITAIFNDRGDELGRVASFKTDVLSREVQPALGVTPFQRLGELPLFIYCILVLSFVIFRILKKNKR